MKLWEVVEHTSAKVSGIVVLLKIPLLRVASNTNFIFEYEKRIHNKGGGVKK